MPHHSVELPLILITVWLLQIYGEAVSK